MRLNENQKIAVETIEGPLLIIAGPGSGKTKTLVERVAYMIEKRGIEPEKIMISTFTERAANEIFTRITERLKDTRVNLNKLYIGTIHSICLRIIDENIEFSNLKTGYNVLDRVDQKFFIYSKLKYFKEIMEFEPLFNQYKHFNNWKIGEELLKRFNKISEGEIEVAGSLIEKAYNFYKQLLFDENSIDFSLIQEECYRILNENREVLSKVEKNIEYLMIDEYQDTNEIQEKLIFLLGGYKKNICVVGDDDQGIYRFRGATIKNILRFKERIGENCKVIHLNFNYRSEKDIVEFCKRWMKLLYWDKYRYNKELEAVGEKNKDRKRVIKLSVLDSEKKWLERIALFLLFLKNNNIITDYNQVAFLFKSIRYRKVITLIDYLKLRGIEVYSPRSNQYFEREEIREIIGCFLYILLRKESSYNRERDKYEINQYYFNCINCLKKIMKADNEVERELRELRDEYKLEKKVGTLLELYYKIISLKMFHRYFQNNQNNILKDRALYNMGIFSKIVKKFDKISKIKFINQDNIVKVGDYFFKVHLNYIRRDGVDEYEDIREYAPAGAVSFLTIHQSKGLEFPVVIVGSLESLPDEREEKKSDFEPTYRIGEFDFWRLYYTAFSRAKNLLILSCIESKNNRREVPSPPFKRIYESIPDASSSEIGYSKLKLENVEKIDIKERFSYTNDLLKFEECPFKYNMNKFFNFERVVTVENIFGILIHKTLEEINKSILKKIELSERKIEDIYYNSYNNLIKQESIRLSEEILKSGLKQILRYFNSDIITKNIIDIEKELYIVEENYMIDGILDMVIEDEDGLKIIDFKSGNEKIENIKIYEQQIRLYSYLLSQNSDKKVVGGELYFIKSGERYFISYNLGDEKEIVARFNILNESVKEKKLNRKILKEDICKKCEFKNYCFNINMV